MTEAASGKIERRCSFFALREAVLRGFSPLIVCAPPPCACAAVDSIASLGTSFASVEMSVLNGVSANAQ